MLISISEASKRWGVARTTIYRNIKNGKLSQTSGKVDHAEMVRCFGEPSLEKKQSSLQDTVLQKQADTLQQRVEELERSVAAALQEKALLLQEKEWLRTQVDKAQETIKLLEYRGHQAPTNEKPKKGLFGRLIGAVLDE
ncbi:plasmid replication DNA-binding protein [Agitococcus lubricus]|uniref:Uncharacterized protein n=1 Tax=Agitococcus lubricus TaxID=1077255 RepID=A0A2T5IQQ8_9GAMM|nr:plasmid replication DNA-binding protein [Agitococcus lubricus]PTQ86175.1 hypothetical protein C8N29_1452 [Agitococcus lubricus]